MVDADQAMTLPTSQAWSYHGDLRLRVPNYVAMYLRRATSVKP